MGKTEKGKMELDGRRNTVPRNTFQERGSKQLRSIICGTPVNDRPNLDTGRQGEEVRVLGGNL